MSKEAMKLALEALDAALSDDQPYIEKSKQAITALREALAKPDFWEGYVPEPVKPAQQEPVAWMLDGEFYKTQQFHLQGGHYANQIPLYTTPPQRTWVGLTDEERKLVRNSVGYNQFVTAGEYAEHVQKATEFKLLEKNNG